MIPLLWHFVGWLVGAFRSREDPMLENLALRQQLLALGGRNRFCSSPQKRWCVGIALDFGCTGLGCRGLDTPPEGNP